MSNLIDRINQHLRQNCHSGDAMKLLREASAELVRLHGQIEFQRRQQEEMIGWASDMRTADSALKHRRFGPLPMGGGRY